MRSSPDSAVPSSSTRDGAADPRAPAGAVPGPATESGEPDQFDVARQIVLRQLAAAPRSRAQLAAALARRRCPADVAEAVLDRLAEAGLVDDTEFAHLLTRSQQAGRGLARAAVAHQLRRKGVNEDVVADVVAGITDAHDREQARRLVAKRMRSLHGLDATVQARRLGGMLARKGYPAGLALAVIREAVAGAPEHQRD